jgi:DNA-binding phage protein
VNPPASLDTLEAVAAHLAAAFESGDADAMRAGEMSLDTTLAIMKVIDLHTPT